MGGRVDGFLFDAAVECWRSGRGCGKLADAFSGVRGVCQLLPAGAPGADEGLEAGRPHPAVRAHYRRQPQRGGVRGLEPGRGEQGGGVLSEEGRGRGGARPCSA
eukprot:365498-Chlamydomonas_euryale.AAC.11